MSNYFYRLLCHVVKLILFSAFTSVYADDEIKILYKLLLDYPDWKPRGIVDVGANIGGWTTKVQNSLPGIPTLMVEASTTHKKELEETKQKFSNNVVDYQIAVLSSSDGDIIDFFSLDGKGTGNSMFVEQSHHYKDVKPVQRTTSKLDTLIKNSHLDHIDYLKLDVQGAELMVLSGASETLKKVTFVQLEVSVIEYNKGGSCWHEIDEILRHNGFHFYDSSDYIRNEGAFHTKGIGQFEVLYIKQSSAYMPKWLLDHKVQFCGSGRNNTTRATTEKVQNSVRGEKTMLANSPVVATDASTNTKIQHHTVFSLLSVVTAFLLGYTIGQRRVGVKGLMKSN
mmetsp:Transcript_20805/g.34305  ORF Transcript_20805/g.34305 Transcript_20805/m.34305 type:complete len:339 (-) Transcript_20805:30-1046(-)|eukprot:scaffold7313_cov144-Skeletonema_menzelii.AAC.3